MILTEEDISTFVNTLKELSLYDFTEYSYKSLTRRISKVLVDHNLELQALLELMKRDPEFRESIVCEITVNTTELFRDPVVWQTLRYSILPKFRNSNRLRILHAGCSTGQEVYSMMILLNELGLFEKAEIVGTDINSKALEIAKRGVYNYRFNLNYLDNFDKVIKEIPGSKQLKEVPYSNYFSIDKIRDTITVKEFLLKKPLFLWHNLVSPEDPPIGNFDLILCRNVIIYFNFSLQNKLFKYFLNCLFDKGILVLGAHESMIGPYSDHFEKVDQINIKK